MRHHTLGSVCQQLLAHLTLVCLLLAATPTNASVDAHKLPSLGDTSSSTISPQLEREIGEGFLKQLHASLRTSDDPLIKYYVEQQLLNLAQHSDLRDGIMQVVVIDNPDINAFAAPGGVIGVNLGLLLQARDVHEYSSVMAHELAHLSQRHFARGVEEQRANALPTLAALIGALIIGAAGGGDAALAALSTAQAASFADQMRFSRDREQEADRIGMNTMARANLDPSGASRMFERMARAYRFTRRPPEFLLTHPLSETRIADVRNQALGFPRRLYEDSLDYQLMRVRAEVHYQKSPNEGIQKYRRAVQDDPTNLVANYGLALSLSEAGQHDEALQRVERLVNENPQSILYNSAFAELLIAADQTPAAMRMLSHQLVLNPDNAPLSMLYANALNKEGKHVEAEEVLQRMAQVYPHDVDVWYELAETAGLAGNITGVHLARADYFYLHGAYQRAVQHLEYAQRLVRRTNPQLQSKLSQRLQDLRTEIRRQRG